MADPAFVLTAVAGVVTATAGLVSAFVILLREIRAGHRAVEEVHTIVNQQRTDMVARIDQLADTLQKHGVHVPKEGSVPQSAGDAK